MDKVFSPYVTVHKWLPLATFLKNMCYHALCPTPQFGTCMQLIWPLFLFFALIFFPKLPKRSLQLDKKALVKYTIYPIVTLRSVAAFLLLNVEWLRNLINFWKVGHCCRVNASVITRFTHFNNNNNIWGQYVSSVKSKNSYCNEI